MTKKSELRLNTSVVEILAGEFRRLGIFRYGCEIERMVGNKPIYNTKNFQRCYSNHLIISSTTDVAIK